MINNIIFDSNKTPLYANKQENPLFETSCDEELDSVLLKTVLRDDRQLWYSTICILSAWSIIRTIKTFDDMWVPIKNFRIQPFQWNGFIMEYITKNGYDSCE